MLRGRTILAVIWSLGLLCAGPLLAACPAACATADSVEQGCETREDCPRPDRQTCDVATGVCVGFTSLPGVVDGGDGEGIDAGDPPDAGP
jgi:hypothetical protein